eukprot:m.496664 g.496664  ORF g.496664 m.496664 type:complete len:129 (-) comp48287_c0_seq1:257-643(-)
MKLAAGAGVFAALASTFCKLTVDATACLAITSSDHVLIRGLMLACMLASNGFMWVLFSRALEASSSSLTPTVINTAFNFVTSALLGSVVFSEPLSWTWAAGTSLIVCGLALVHAYEERAPDKTEDKSR